jgi:hypothetical protein
MDEKVIQPMSEGRDVIPGIQDAVDDDSPCVEKILEIS